MEREEIFMSTVGGRQHALLIRRGAGGVRKTRVVRGDERKKEKEEGGDAHINKFYSGLSLRKISQCIDGYRH